MMATNSLARSRAAITNGLYLASAVFCVIASTGCSSCKKDERDTKAGPLTPGITIKTPSARAAYVTNNGSDTISVIDRDGDLVETASLDIDPDAHEAPHHLVVDPSRKWLFVALAFPPSVKSSSNNNTKKKDPHASHGGGSDPGKLARLDLTNLSVIDTVDVDENPGDVVLTHDFSRVLVTHFDMKRAMDVAAKGAASPATMFAELVVLDTKTMTRVGSRPICTAPHGVAVAKDDRTAYVACYGSDDLGIIDLKTDGFPTARIPLGSSPGVPGVPRYGPYSATLSPDEKIVVVADLEGQDVRVFDIATKQFVTERTVPLAAKAFMPAFVDGSTIIVPTQAPDGIVRIDIDHGKVLARGALTKAECALPHVVKVSSDGRVYLVCEGDHIAPGSVMEIDRDTLAMKKRWVVGVYPDGIDFGSPP